LIDRQRIKHQIILQVGHEIMDLHLLSLLQTCKNNSPWQRKIDARGNLQPMHPFNLIDYTAQITTHLGNKFLRLGLIKPGPIVQS
tara:strand:+ start:223 stop:477 length:255 start_codon:yes stop_codon:yes gene_type:complete